MRVYLIYPSIDCPPGINHGLASISGVLKTAGHDVRLLHVCEKIWPIPEVESILAGVAGYEPGIVGISLLTMQVPWAEGVARAIRARFPAIPIVAGGVHCTMVPEETVASDAWDYVCLGEGEYAFLELVRRIEAGEDTTTCPNMWMRRGGEIVRNAVLPYPDLQAIPFTDYELFQMDEILAAKNGWLSILTSRGCPYKCTYCFNYEIVERYVEDGAARSAKEFLRHYPVERVIDEIRELRRLHPGVKTVIFDDDLFTLNKRYVSEFCAKYRASGLDLPFVVNAHVACFGDEMAKDLAGAGCRIVKFGLESGNPRIRRQVMLRHMTNDQIVESFEAAHKYDMHSSAFVMFGLPTETRAEVEDTLDLCARIKMGRFRWALFFPFPGTGGYRLARELDLIDPERFARMGNYFDGTCLRFDAAHSLWLDKLSRLCSWFVNARTDWACAPVYRRLVDEVEALDRDGWEARKKDLVAYDRELSEDLMRQGLVHYTIRYAHVMGVRSDYIENERRREARTAQEWNLAYTLD